MLQVLALILIMSIVAPLSATADSLFKVTKLTDNLHMLSTDQGEYTTNTLVFFGDDGLLLVDTQTEAEAEELKKLVDSYGKGTPKYIINTHRHVEHIGGNAIFGVEPIVIAHELFPSKLKSGSYIFNEYPPATYPDITVSDKYTLEFNGESIEIIPMGGGHDDNEIIVHFTKSKVVHISSLVNGFNFPSVDSDGDVLMLAPLVAKAIEMLPKDVVIVSGHNDTGTWDDLRAYHDMLVQTIEVVRKGLAEGKDLATLQEEKILAEWESYAGSYVSADEWMEYLVEGMRDGKDDRPTPHVPIYHEWKKRGAAAAVALFRELKRDHADEYSFREFILLGIGDKLYKKNYLKDAILFLEASLEEYPEGKYNYYIHYELADANKQLGDKKLAMQHCEKSLELNPDFDAAKVLLEELKKN
ncbi:MAG: MBL fold metallo-hydrolase [Candidatus Latescibacteria bacterium]|nr:MBL fold metallo-hydrolase [Candidatus Latescibacterota bacterium]NIO57316.1 MBL fold metallo-hydrolase [Candidatus Latescibacterota bacterium]